MNSEAATVGRRSAGAREDSRGGLEATPENVRFTTIVGVSSVNLPRSTDYMSPIGDHA
jgi:hypothetical protein